MVRRQNKMENNEDYIIKMPSVKGNINPNGVGCYCYEMMTLHKDKIAQVRVKIFNFLISS